MIKTKSVYSGKEPKKDGLRILATRIRGRGLPKSEYDVWMANLGPSQKLKDAFQNQKIAWGAFSRLYRKELFESDGFDRKNKLIKNHGQKFTLRLIQKLAKKGTVTVMCHCDEDLTCPQSWDTSKLKFGWYWLVDVVDGCWVDCNPVRREAVGRLEHRVVAATVLTGS